MRYLLLILCCVSLYVSCRKDEIPTSGKATAEKDGELWEAKTQCFLDTVRQMAILHLLVFKQGTKVESLSSRWFPLNEGDYCIQDTGDCVQSSYHRLTADGDAVIVSYTSPEAEMGSFLRITSYDKTCNILEGEFEYTLHRLHNLEQFSETMRFANGKFSVEIEER